MRPQISSSVGLFCCCLAAAFACACTSKLVGDGSADDFTDDLGSDDVSLTMPGHDAATGADATLPKKDAKSADVGDVGDGGGVADGKGQKDGGDTADGLAADGAGLPAVDVTTSFDIVGDVLATSGDWWGVDGNGKGVQKVTTLSILPATSGCDLTGDGVVDNTFSALAGLMNGNIGMAIMQGTLVILFNPSAWDANGSPFQFSILGGAPDTSAAACDYTGAGCSYTVSAANFTANPCGGACSAKSTVKALNQGGQMIGNAKLVTIPIQFGALLALHLEALTFTGTVTDSNAWTTTTSGQMCGFITTSNLLSAIDQVPDAIWAQTSMTKAQIEQLLPVLMPADIDSDGDGVNDAISLALGIETKLGVITGIAN